MPMGIYLIICKRKVGCKCVIEGNKAIITRNYYQRLLAKKAVEQSDKLSPIDYAGIHPVAGDSLVYKQVAREWTVLS